MGFNLDAFSGGDIHHVDTQHNRHRQAQELCEQIEISLYGSGIGDHHDDVRPFLQNKISGNLFFKRVGGEAVGSRQVDHTKFDTVVNASTFAALNRLTRPVANVLIQARQQIKDGGLPDVGLAPLGRRSGLSGRFG